MGKKKRGHAVVEDILSRPWCYYCERDFEDLKLLISHQKAKHFKCDKCGRRLNTAGGLSVHMNQVHKESLTAVENALPNRKGLEVEIFGMEGIPEDVIQQHNQRIIQTFYQQQADRYAATGNPPPGQGQGQRKRLKIESADDLKTRLAEFRTRQKAPGGGSATHTPQNGAPDGQSPSQNNSPFPPPNGQYAFSPPPHMQQGNFQYPPSNLPSRPPGSVPAAADLPPRPGQQGWQGQSVDELIASASRQGQGDDIDQIIRMAEAGIKPPKKAEVDADEAAGEKKSKKEKEKNVRMIYEDDVSPEERLAAMARYRFVPEVEA